MGHLDLDRQAEVYRISSPSAPAADPAALEFRGTLEEAVRYVTERPRERDVLAIRLTPDAADEGPLYRGSIDALAKDL